MSTHTVFILITTATTARTMTVRTMTVRTMTVRTMTARTMTVRTTTARTMTARTMTATARILLRSKQNAEFFDFLDENRLIFVVLSGRFQNLF